MSNSSSSRRVRDVDATRAPRVAATREIRDTPPVRKPRRLVLRGFIRRELQAVAAVDVHHPDIRQLAAAHGHVRNLRTVRRHGRKGVSAARVAGQRQRRTRRWSITRDRLRPDLAAQRKTREAETPAVARDREPAHAGHASHRDHLAGSAAARPLPRRTECARSRLRRRRRRASNCPARTPTRRARGPVRAIVVSQCIESQNPDPVVGPGFENAEGNDGVRRNSRRAPRGRPSDGPCASVRANHGHQRPRPRWSIRSARQTRRGIRRRVSSD